MKKWLVKILPWVLCIAIFTYIFTKTNPRELWQSLQLANIPLLFLYGTLYFFFAHTVDCFTLKHFISRFAAPITHKESWIVRGVSYLFMIFNYQAAQGAFAVYFKKTHNASAFKTLGTLAFVNIMDIILIVTYAGIAVWLTPHTPANDQLRASVTALLLALYIFYILFVLFWKNTHRPFMTRLKKFKLIRWLLEHNIFLVFREATLKDFAELVLYRVVLTFVAMGVFNLALFAFHARLSWGDIYLYNPFVLLVSLIPITPSGLGTSQFMIIEFFKNRVQSPLFASETITPEALLLTASLVWFLTNQILKAIFGSVCLSLSSKRLFSEKVLTPNP